MFFYKALLHREASKCISLIDFIRSYRVVLGLEYVMLCYYNDRYNATKFDYNNTIIDKFGFMKTRARR